MSHKFIDVPKDEDTKIKFSHVIQIDGIEVLHQKWRWSGITAESFIFSAEDAARLGREQILQIAINSGLIKDVNKITCKDEEGDFVFVNFNFKY